MRNRVDGYRSVFHTWRANEELWGGECVVQLLKGDIHIYQPEVNLT